jgi:hypothetical protein
MNVEQNEKLKVSKQNEKLKTPKLYNRNNFYEKNENGPRA